MSFSKCLFDAPHYLLGLHKPFSGFNNFGTGGVFRLSEVYLGGVTMITFVVAEEITYDVTI